MRASHQPQPVTDADSHGMSTGWGGHSKGKHLLQCLHIFATDMASQRLNAIQIDALAAETLRTADNQQDWKQIMPRHHIDRTILLSPGDFAGVIAALLTSAQHFCFCHRNPLHYCLICRIVSRIPY